MSSINQSQPIQTIPAGSKGVNTLDNYSSIALQNVSDSLFASNASSIGSGSCKLYGESWDSNNAYNGSITGVGHFEPQSGGVPAIQVMSGDFINVVFEKGYRDACDGRYLSGSAILDTASVSTSPSTDFQLQIVKVNGIVNDSVIRYGDQVTISYKWTNGKVYYLTTGKKYIWAVANSADGVAPDSTQTWIIYTGVGSIPIQSRMPGHITMGPGPVQLPRSRPSRPLKPLGPSSPSQKKGLSEEQKVAIIVVSLTSLLLLAALVYFLVRYRRRSRR